jgi:hypothetical protein
MALTAQANTSSFTFTQDGCSGSCGVSPFATVTITDFGSGAEAYVLVTETLGAGDAFVRTGAGGALEFQLTHAATSITDLTAGFSVARGTQTASTFGAFSNGITCSLCGNGASHPLSGPLSFQVWGVTTADFVANQDGNYFASDILGSNGNTGNVAAIDGPSGAAPLIAQQEVITPTPEPASVLLCFSALVLVALNQARVWSVPTDR